MPSPPASQKLLARCCCALLAAVAACSTDDGAADGASAAADAGDGAPYQPLDVPTFDVADPRACPGGGGCACVADDDCGTGLCLERVGAAAQVCATACPDAICPEGQRCRELAGSAGLRWVCVDGRARLCDPCQASAQCRGLGGHDSACVDYGPAGAFCGVACQGDADCGAGYRCASARSVEGEDGMRCVRAADAGADPASLGRCPCSAEAAAAAASTACYAETFDAKGRRIGRCVGARSCGPAGLSDCSAATPAAEACDGQDNDCDGQTDEGTCDDGEPCTADACAGAAGCSHTPQDQPCDADGSACTAPDACQGGGCVAGAKLDCDDGNACTTDACHPLKGCQHAPTDGAACDDGSACSAGEACLAGACQGGAAKACGDDQPCTLDACADATGACSNTLVKGLLCDDGDPCSHTDLCDAAGVCAGSPVGCDDGNPCTTDACDPAKGCVQVASPDGAGCDDGNPCTGDGTCSAAVCLTGPAVVCAAPGPCFVAHCFAKTGACVASQRPAGVLCDDGDPCTGAGLCDANAGCAAPAIACDDGNPCTTDACLAGAGCAYVGKAAGSPCDDGDACTVGDGCGAKDGAAVACLPGKATTCDDANPCTTESCSADKGCVYADVAEGAPCSDGDDCTSGDACKAGVCAPGVDLCFCDDDGDCDDSNPCTADACLLASNLCSNAPASGSCDDGDACTKGDSCGLQGGTPACLPGPPTSCDDADVCTEDDCDALLGCVYGAAKDGTLCNDGEPCTENDGCVSGKCAGAALPAVVSTFAGSSAGSNNGKGALAKFMAPTGLARVGEALYVADFFDHRVRVIAADQTVGWFVGQGVAGDLDGKADSARFRGPAALVGDGAGKLYVVDAQNHKIRVVSIADAAVVTLAGSNTPGGFGQPPTGGYADGTGAAAKFNLPMGVAASAGGFVIADAGNHRLRTLSAAGEVQTLAGSGAEGGADGPAAIATFSAPSGVAVAADGAIYVSDRTGHRIRRLQGGLVTTVAGDGSAGASDGKGAGARFSSPWGLWLDGAGALLVADNGNHRVRRVAADGAVTTYAGAAKGNDDGPLATATFDGPTALVDDGKGKLWVVTQTGFRVRLIDDAGKACQLTP